jgi:hypothetical protein
MAFSRANRSKADNEVDILTKGWLAITEKDDPIEFKAWANYRRDKFGCVFIPKAFTVPTEFPPVTPEAEENYRAALSKIREAVGWFLPRKSVTKQLSRRY